MSRTLLLAQLGLCGLGCAAEREVRVRCVSHPPGAEVTLHYPPDQETTVGTAPLDTKVRVPRATGFLEARLPGYESGIAVLGAGDEIVNEFLLVPDVCESLQHGRRYPKVEIEQAMSVVTACFSLSADDPKAIRAVAAQARDIASTIDGRARGSPLGTALRALGARCHVLAEVVEAQADWYAIVYAELAAKGLAQKIAAGLYACGWGR